MWGAGALGSCAVAILRALYPDVEVAVVARFDAQADLATRLGAHKVVRLGSQEELVEELAAWSGGVLRPTMEGLGGLPMCHPGGIDVAYDTVGKPETFEVEVRVLKARGTLVKSGVHAPGRWEWSPLYFKEISWVGSNAFGIEEVEGVRKHGIEHYLDLVAAGRIDLTGLLTHTFGLSRVAGRVPRHRRPRAQRGDQGRHRPTEVTAMPKHRDRRLHLRHADGADAADEEARAAQGRPSAASPCRPAPSETGGSSPSSPAWAPQLATTRDRAAARRASPPTGSWWWASPVRWTTRRRSACSSTPSASCTARPGPSTGPRRSPMTRRPARSGRRT